MSILNLIVPGLLGPFSEKPPQYIVEQLLQAEFKQLRTWLSRSQIKNIQPANYYQTVQSVICPQCDLSICELTAQFDQVESTSGFLYRLDPVHFKAESDHAVLLGSSLLNIEMEEAKQLIEAFNHHFVDESVRLIFGDSDRWYLETQKPLKLKFNAVDYSLGRDIKHFMPAGDDALWWRKILNEAQMLFFSHSVNQQREANAQLAVNGLWLWDMSFESMSDITNDHRVYTDNTLVKAMAEQSSLPVASLSEFVSYSADDINVNDVTTLVFDEIYEAVCYGDVNAWAESLQLFCDSNLSNIKHLLNDKIVNEINIYSCDGRVFCVDKLSLLKFWKKVQALQNYMAKTN